MDCMHFISFVDVPLTPQESNFIGQIGADLLIRTGVVPNNTAILKEVIYRAMLVNGKDIPDYEKQATKKVVYTRTNTGKRGYACPRCKNFLEYTIPNYCCKCGQKIESEDFD